MAFLPVYVLILVVTIIVDYFAGIYIYKARGVKRKWILIISLIANIGFLCFFKYFDFIVGTVNDFTSLQLPFMNELWVSSIIIDFNNWTNLYLNSTVGTNYDILHNIILPIGLSFHTFQAMSYTIEVYRGNQKPERHFGIYSLYVMFYPQLVAGPIERPQNLLPQFHAKHKFNIENLLIGLRLMAWGLFKKVVIADRLAIYVNMVYEDPQNYHWLNLVIATIFFGIQIYCDFSGYSDMAIGAAKTMGFDLMINFRRPYFAANIKEFWDKWHISLSTWFRDYLYIPLGGSRKGFNRQLINLGVVFVISGIWHGANLTFVVWGILHAMFSIVYMVFDKTASSYGIKRSGILWSIGGWVITFSLVSFAWIFFRAADIQQAFDIITQIVSLDNSNSFKMVLVDDGLGLKSGFGISSLLIFLFTGSYLIWVEKKFNPSLIEFQKSPVKDIIFISFTLFLVIVLGVFVKQSFIYFQF